MKTTVAITGVHLYRVGAQAIVAVEINGRWIPVIHEAADNAYSHIVGIHGIETSAKHDGETCDRCYCGTCDFVEHE
jgi:hypothetical protein